MTCYKVLGEQQRSYHGGTGRWVKNRWRAVEGELVECENGIHYCRRDQLIGWLGPQIWVFENGTPDEAVDAGGKMVTRRGRVVKRLDRWNEMTARLFAADCAEAVVDVIPDPERARFVEVIRAVRGFARGELSVLKLRTAWDATHRASKTLIGAAGEAWSAARFAQATWIPTWMVAEAASGSAAAAAARANSARANEVWAAARAAQTDILFDYLEGRRP